MNVSAFGGFLNFLIINNRNEDLKEFLDQNKNNTVKIQKDHKWNHLSLAVERFNVKALEILLENNFHVNTNEDEWANPVVKALRLKNIDAISLFIKHGYRYSCKDCEESKWMETCMLMDSIKKKEIKMVNMYIKELSSEEISQTFCRYLNEENFDKEFAYHILNMSLLNSKKINITTRNIERFSSWFNDVSYRYPIFIEMDNYINKKFKN